MPRYYLHYENDERLRDEVGQELADDEAARHAALEAAGELLSEQILRGERVDLDHRIVAECDGETRFTIAFRDLVKLPDSMSSKQQASQT